MDQIREVTKFEPIVERVKAQLIVHARPVMLCERDRGYESRGQTAVATNVERIVEVG